MAGSAPGSAKPRFGWIDVGVLAVLAAAAAYVVHRVDAVLHYRWDWSGVWVYLLRIDPRTGDWALGLLLKGFITTLRLALFGIILAALVGLVFGLARTSKRLFPRLVAGLYVELVRNMPPLVFIFIFYFFLSSQIVPLLGIDRLAATTSPALAGLIELAFGDRRLLANFVSGLFCLVLFEGAYITEIVRAGVLSIDKGQWEAGDSLGLTRLQRMRLVILPQALRRILPALAGQFIMLVKTSSIVSLISIQELTFIATEVAVTSGRVFEIWILVALLYFAVSALLSLAFHRLERGAAAPAH
ncbi:MAG: amino acid ABC transporter permease [Alphaproteobacteria bacterium]|nr:amino acid ABC transporter permease [Alphaproteobacteria bacterium]